METLVRRSFKYLVEGLAVAMAAFYIPKKTMKMNEIASIAMTAAMTFALLDFLAPDIAASARAGAGFGIGAGQVGFP